MNSGISRVSNSYHQSTLELSSTISEISSSLADLKNSAESFLNRMHIDRKSCKDFDLEALVDSNGGFMSLHEAFASLSGMDKFKCVSASSWVSQLSISESLVVSPPFVYSRSNNKVKARLLAVLDERNAGSSVVDLMAHTNFQVSAVKGCLAILLKEGLVVMDESVYGTRYHGNRFI